MDNAYIGSIILFAGNFAPRGWALCQGQLMNIAQNTALFSILGTTYGGDGRTTFALPDLRGRVPVGQGQGPGLSAWPLGQSLGVETVSLIQSQMPAHNHLVEVSGSTANTDTANNNYLAMSNATYGGDTIPVNTYNGTPTATLAVNSISVAGSSMPHENRQPSLCLNYIICLVGLFPSRN
ncbi:phage tail protein [Niastella populi]|uniref:Phage tail protein n=1 Tax=Niastella populi TaxID=550983 RepID=A0A1V9FI23_9BACT|nr:tail fiber protein [Niastella populi]OQP58005.1 phage tail protein [Niastella populi]